MPFGLAQADKKLVLTFGPSNDALGVTMVDSIKVYGKTKEAFGWPDDADDQLLQQARPPIPSTRILVDRVLPSLPSFTRFE